MSLPQFMAETFVSTINTALQKGQEVLEFLIDAYAWANIHLKEIRRHNPGYEQRWLRTQVKRAFNVDPVLYLRAVQKLGGGRRPEELRRGRAMISQFGLYEGIRADRLLTTEQMSKMREKVTEMTTPEEFRQFVDELSGVLKGIHPGKEDGAKLDYKREYMRLLQENASLKKEVELLRAWKDKFDIQMRGFVGLSA